MNSGLASGRHHCSWGEKLPPTISVGRVPTGPTPVTSGHLSRVVRGDPTPRLSDPRLPLHTCFEGDLFHRPDHTPLHERLWGGWGGVECEGRRCERTSRREATTTPGTTSPKLFRREYNGSFQVSPRTRDSLRRPNFSHVSSGDEALTTVVQQRASYTHGSR